MKTMDENYLEFVRKSLYGNSKQTSNKRKGRAEPFTYSHKSCDRTGSSTNTDLIIHSENGILKNELLETIPSVSPFTSERQKELILSVKNYNKKPKFETAKSKWKLQNLAKGRKTTSSNSTMSDINVFKDKLFRKMSVKSDSKTWKIVKTNKSCSRDENKSTAGKTSLVRSEDSNSSNDIFNFAQFCSDYETSLNEQKLNIFDNLKTLIPISSSNSDFIEETDVSINSSINCEQDKSKTNLKTQDTVLNEVQNFDEKNTNSTNVEKNIVNNNHATEQLSCDSKMENGDTKSVKVFGKDAGSVNNNDLSWTQNYINFSSKDIKYFQNTVITDIGTSSDGQFARACKTKEFGLFESTSSNNYYVMQDNKILILLRPQSIFYFYGLIAINILHGQLEFFGSLLTKHCKETNCYSPRGSALLYMRNPNNSESNSEIELVTVLPAIYKKELHGVFVNENSVIVECKRLEDLKMAFVEKYIPQQIFPDIENDLPRVVFNPSENMNRIKVNENWGSFIENIASTTKVVITGGKGVGKSTFLRYAVNKLLSIYKTIRVIDLDPGQSEFTVPGCISIITINEPLYGPNYTHLTATDKSILSDINVMHNVTKYLKSVELLMKFFNELELIPTLVNYMGFIQGLGIEILSVCLKHVNPDIVVQICSEHWKKNSMELLSTENMMKHREFLADNHYSMKYQLVTLESMTDNNEGWSLEPRQAREMCVLSYFGRLMNKNLNLFLGAEINMVSIHFSDIKITNLEGKVVSPLAANANLVALGTLEDNNQFIFGCLGWGIVRGVDLETETLFLISPEEIDILEKVVYLIVASVSLPPSILMTTDDVTGNFPYVNKGELNSFGQFTKRSYIPFKN